MKKSSQTGLSIIIIIIITILGINVYLYQKSLLPILLIGISIGFILYRSGICFATMYQDIILFRDFSMARAVLILLIISLIGINFIQVHAHLNGQVIPGKFHSVGMHTVIGGFLFGVGMTLAGGCASGTLQRIGEGFLLFWFVLFGMVFGSVLGVYHFSGWVNNFFSFKPVFLPNIFGWLTSTILSLTVLGSIYYLTFLFENRPRAKKRGEKYGTKKINPLG